MTIACTMILDPATSNRMICGDRASRVLRSPDPGDPRDGKEFLCEGCFLEMVDALHKSFPHIEKDKQTE